MLSFVSAQMLLEDAEMEQIAQAQKMIDNSSEKVAFLDLHAPGETELTDIGSVKETEIGRFQALAFTHRYNGMKIKGRLDYYVPFTHKKMKVRAKDQFLSAVRGVNLDRLSDASDLRSVFYTLTNTGAVPDRCLYFEKTLERVYEETIYFGYAIGEFCFSPDHQPLHTTALKLMKSVGIKYRFPPHGKEEFTHRFEY